MLETEAIHLVARLDRIGVIREADERKTLGHSRIPILGQEHSRNTTEALEHVAQLALFRHLGDLAGTVSFT